jgi:hypothetical protein
MAAGEAAAEYWEALDRLRECWAAWGAKPLWLSPLRAGRDQAAHPQQVEAAHNCGILPHAACLPFFDELEDATPGVYGGLGVVHRREPLRPLDTAGRLEAYHIAETIIVGDQGFCAEAYTRIRHDIGQLLARYVAGKWQEARDLFDRDLRAKEEWICGSGAQALAVASGNVHGPAFLHRRNLPGESRCFGVGIERLIEVKRRSVRHLEGDDRLATSVE